jgi:hypothetical protein
MLAVTRTHFFIARSAASAAERCHSLCLPSGPGSFTGQPPFALVLFQPLRSLPSRLPEVERAITVSGEQKTVGGEGLIDHDCLPLAMGSLRLAVSILAPAADRVLWIKTAPIVTIMAASRNRGIAELTDLSRLNEILAL